MAEPEDDPGMLDGVHDDAWENVITGLGTSRDKRLGGAIVPPVPAGTREVFEQIHAGDDIAATIAELPAGEMFREWITMNVDDSAEDESSREQDAEERVDTAKKVMQKLDELSAQSLFTQAKVWARVQGGSLLFLGVNDGHGGDLTQPLDENALVSVDFLKVFDRWDVTTLQTFDDLSEPNFGQPKIYALQTTTETGQQTIPHTQIHASRFIRFDGVLTSRQRLARNNGWSDSIYTRLESVLRDFGMAWGGVAHLLQDFSQAVFKMKGLARAIAADKDSLVLNRIATMDMCRGVSRLVPIDAEGEDLIRTPTPVAGLPDLMDRFALRLSAAARMPVSLMMGMSPAGLSATGQADIRFFYDQIARQQVIEAKPSLMRLIHLILVSSDGPTHGIEPDNWSITFNPLWQLSDVEQATVRKSQAETDAIYIGNDVLTSDEVANSRFGGDTYSTETILDTNERDEDALLEEPDTATGEPEPIDLGGGGDLESGDVSKASDTALNGAQIQSLVDIAKAVAEGTLPKATAIQIIAQSFVSISTAQATGMLAAIAEPDEPKPKTTVTPPVFTPPEPRLMHADVIEKRGDMYVVMSKSGEVLGEHHTEAAAQAHLRAIEANKEAR